MSKLKLIVLAFDSCDFDNVIAKHIENNYPSRASSPAGCAHICCCFKDFLSKYPLWNTAFIICL